MKAYFIGQRGIRRDQITNTKKRIGNYPMKQHCNNKRQLQLNRNTIAVVFYFLLLIFLRMLNFHTVIPIGVA
jgi:hypothetical protein